jgi:hypothetical protein
MTRSHEGLTCLFVGIVTNAPIEIIELLVKKRPALVDVKNNEEIAPIHEAIKVRRLDIVKVLIENGANVNVFDLDLENSLHYAASNCDYEIIEYLLKETEIDPRAKNRDDLNPISLLIVRSRNEPADVVSSCFHIMLENSFEKDVFTGTYLIDDIFQVAFLAAVYSHKEIVKFIIHTIYSINNSKYDLIKQLCDAYNSSDGDDEEFFYYLLVFLHDKIDRFDKFSFSRFSEINYFMGIRSVMHVIEKLLITQETVSLAIRLISQLEDLDFQIIRVREFEDNFGSVLYTRFSNIDSASYQNQLESTGKLLEFFKTRRVKINRVIKSFLHSIAIAAPSEINNFDIMAPVVKLLLTQNGTFFVDEDCWKQINEFKNLHLNVSRIILWINEQFGTTTTCNILDIKHVYPLKHICRNLIRDQMKNNLESLVSLDLPQSLVNYLVYKS